jgi:hypothetical protein
MKESVQVAHLVNGEVISVRVLSPRNERRVALLAATTVLGLTAAWGSAVAVALALAHRTVFGPEYLSLWGAVGLGAACLAAARARTRARRYVVGADIDDDAFAPHPVELVRRTRAGYELAVTAGMRGHLESASGTSRGQALGLGREGAERVLLLGGAHAEVSTGATTFALQHVADDAARLSLGRGFIRSFAKQALIPLQLAALACVVRAIPEGRNLDDADMKSAIPGDASPWEVEKLLRLEAQRQAGTLYTCFDSLPLSCQHQGYVGVGLSLARSGEIRSQWIARSTFGHECPVDACMSSVISSWFFDSLPESMRIVLPVQVLRTDRPLPAHAAQARRPAPQMLAQNGMH